MKKQTVQEYLDALILLDSEKYDIVILLRDKVKQLNLTISERMMYGGIMFSLKEDLGGIFVYKNHVSFEFGQGFNFKDPDHLLQGKRKYRRHLKINNMNDISFIKADFYIKQMFMTSI